MGTIAGSKKLKRQMAPPFWGITRKDKRFIITVMPGTHPKDRSIPTAVLLRDTLKIVTSLREAKSVIYGGKVKVDGIVRKSLHYSIGLMDVIELEGIPDVYRLVPVYGHILKPIKINAAEKSKKLVKIVSKTTIKGKKTQLGFHDGRTLITDTIAHVGDTCLIQFPKLKILDVIKMEKNSQVIVTGGANVGHIGRIDNINNGTNKVVLNMGIGKSGEAIEIGKAALRQIIDRKSNARNAKKSQRDWGVRKGEPIGIITTVRDKDANILLKKLLDAKGNQIAKRSFDNEGNFSFGISEHIDIPGVKYDPNIGILGLDIAVSLARPGFNIRIRSRHKARIGMNHRITKQQAIEFMTDEYKVTIV